MKSSKLPLSLLQDRKKVSYLLCIYSPKELLELLVHVQLTGVPSKHLNCFTVKEP